MDQVESRPAVPWRIAALECGQYACIDKLLKTKKHRRAWTSVPYSRKHEGRRPLPRGGAKSAGR